MKKLFMIGLIALAGAAGAQTKTANITPMAGNMYVFTDCQPVDAFESLGTVKVIFSWTGKPKETRNRLIKKAQRKYPQCQGIIWTIIDNEANVIKFKE